MLVGPPGPAGAGGENDAVDLAYTHFSDESFEQAAGEFETLWQTSQEPRFLFNAAVSRFSARHFVQAIEHLELYLRQPTLPEQERRVAEEQLLVARSKVFPVELIVLGNPSEASGQLSIDLESQDHAVLHRNASLQSGQAHQRIHLDVGEWHLKARCPGVDPRELTETLLVQQHPPTRILLDCRRPEPPPARREPPIHRRSLLVGGLFGGATFVSGTIAAGYFLDQRADLLDTPKSSTLGAFIRLDRFAGVGLALAGLGAGVAISSGTAALRSSRTRRTTWIVELSTGGALAIGGFAARFAYMDRENHQRAGQSVDESPQRAFDGKLAMDSLLGLGAGLFVASAANLIAERAAVHTTRRAHRRAHWRVDTRAGTRYTGLEFSLRF
jgi:hypothetical protein